jgi:16S rRNA (guanine527-N7)-methyltransferase
MALELSPGVLAAIDAQARLLAAWGRHVNLTAIRDPIDVVRLHVLDSLSAVAPVRARVAPVRSVVDIGSGGGYPGLPLGLALGGRSVSLVDSVGRKARFLEVAGAAATAAVSAERALDVEVLAVRAEELAAGDRRATWDVATLRAVGSVAECAELGLPLLRPGGLLVCWKRDVPDAAKVARGSEPTRDVATEVAAARQLIDQLGGGTPEVVDAGVPGAPGHRLVLVRQDRPTPGAYPRTPVARRGGAERSGRGHRGSARRS